MTESWCPLRDPAWQSVSSAEFPRSSSSLAGGVRQDWGDQKSGRRPACGHSHCRLYSVLLVTTVTSVELLLPNVLVSESEHTRPALCGLTSTTSRVGPQLCFSWSRRHSTLQSSLLLSVLPWIQPCPRTCGSGPSPGPDAWTSSLLPADAPAPLCPQALLSSNCLP